jgi:[ribosomal protein S5]-alanine N-acetyltransferase
MNKIIFPMTGPHIEVRKLRKHDIPKLYDLETDPDVKRYVGGVVKRPKEEWVTGMRLRMQRPSDVLPFAIIDKAAGDFVGRATISPKDCDGSWEIQILIAKRYWGKRLGREVCELLMTALYRDLGAQSIVAVVHPDNKASRALVEASEFVRIGVNQTDRWDTDRWDNGHMIYRHEQTDEVAIPSRGPSQSDRKVRWAR